jgi:hypothetical protein
MRNERFNTSKCRSKLQKMGVMYTHPLPRSLGPCYMQGPLRKLKEKSFQKKKFNFKKLQFGCWPRSLRPTASGRLLVAAGRGCPVISDQRSGCSRWPATNARRPLQRRFPLYCTRTPLLLTSCPKKFAHVVNSSSLAPAHAYPAQTSLKNFKHP